MYTILYNSFRCFWSKQNVFAWFHDMFKTVLVIEDDGILELSLVLTHFALGKTLWDAFLVSRLAVPS